MPTLFLRIAQWLCLECARDISHKDISHLDEEFGKKMERLTGISRMMTNKPSPAEVLLPHKTVSEYEIFVSLQECVKEQIVQVEHNRKLNTNQPVLSFSFGMRLFQEQTVGTVRSTYENRLAMLPDRMTSLWKIFEQKGLLNIPLDKVKPADELRAAFAVYAMLNELRSAENGKTYVGMALELLRPTDLSNQKKSIIQEAESSLASLEELKTRGRDLVASRLAEMSEEERADVSYRSLIDSDPKLHEALLDVARYLAGAALYDERVLEESNRLAKGKLYNRINTAHEKLQFIRIQERSHVKEESTLRTDHRTVFMKTLADIVQLRLEIYEEKHKDYKEKILNPTPLLKGMVEREIKSAHSDNDKIENILSYIDTYRNDMEKKSIREDQSFINFLMTLSNELQELYNEFVAAKLIDISYRRSDRDCFNVVLISIIKYRIDTKFKTLYEESWRSRIAATLSKPEVQHEKQKIANELYQQLRNGIEQLLDPETSEAELNKLEAKMVLNISKNAFHLNAVLIEMKSLSSGQLQSLLSDVIRIVNHKVNPPSSKLSSLRAV